MVDNRGVLWIGESSAHPVHRGGPVLPSGIPRFTHVPHSPIRHLHVMPFTRTGDGARCVAEQWTTVWRSCGQGAAGCGRAVDNGDRPLWTDQLSTDCGSSLATIPQPADLRGSSSPGWLCGQDRDNLELPRVWTVDNRGFCGETRCAAINRTPQGRCSAWLYGWGRAAKGPGSPGNRSRTPTRSGAGPRTRVHRRRGGRVRVGDHGPAPGRGRRQGRRARAAPRRPGFPFPVRVRRPQAVGESRATAAEGHGRRANGRARPAARPLGPMRRAPREPRSEALSAAGGGGRAARTGGRPRWARQPFLMRFVSSVTWL